MATTCIGGLNEIKTEHWFTLFIKDNTRVCLSKCSTNQKLNLFFLPPCMGGTQNVIIPFLLTPKQSLFSVYRLKTVTLF